MVSEPTTSRADSAPSSPRGPGLRVALSGGGSRASLFALGAMLYLVESGTNSRVEAISSVSGGSITNGVLAASFDFSRVSEAEFNRVAASVARTLVERGIVFSSWLSRAYVAALATLMALVVSAWAFRFPFDLSRPACLAIAFVCVVAASLRGWLIDWRLGSLFFRSEGRKLRLGELARSILHVFCATDLPEGEPVFFLGWSGGGYIASVGLGAAEAGDLPLQTIVRASAAFPGGVPPKRLPVRRFKFKRYYRQQPVLYLADGGVWNNLGTQWFEEMRELSSIFSPNETWLQLPASVLQPSGTDWTLPGVDAPHELLIDASAPLARVGEWRFGIPFLSEIAALSRSVGVLYQNTVSPITAQLSGWLLRSSSVGKTPASYVVTPSGALSAHVGLTRIMGDAATSIDAAYGREQDHRSQGSARRERTDIESRAVDSVRYLTEIYHRTPSGPSLTRLDQVTSRIPTTLSRVKRADAIALLAHGYLATMVETHLVFGYPLLDFPGVEKFEKLLDS